MRRCALLRLGLFLELFLFFLKPNFFSDLEFPLDFAVHFRHEFLFFFLLFGI